MSLTVEIPRSVAPAADTRPRHSPVVSGPQPWAPTDLGRLTLFLGVGGVILLGAWVGASGTDDYAVQLRWIAVGIAGLVAAGVGGALWILAAFRNTRARQRAGAASVAGVIEAPKAAVVDRVPDSLVTVESGTRYHR